MPCPICRLSNCDCLVWLPIMMAIIIAIFISGRLVGFKEGADRERFDKIKAEKKIQACLKIVSERAR